MRGWPRVWKVWGRGATKNAKVLHMVMRREQYIQKVRMERKVTYAEAVRLSREQNSASNDHGTPGVRELQQRTNDKISVDKRALVTFIAGVVNYCSQVKK